MKGVWVLFVLLGLFICLAINCIQQSEFTGMPVTIVTGNSVPNTNKVDDSLCKNAKIVKFNHHWLLSPTTFSKNVRYTVVIHNGSASRTFSELKKQNMFGSIDEIVVCTSLEGAAPQYVITERKIADARLCINTYKDDIGTIPIRIISKDELAEVYRALHDKRFPKSTVPRTGPAYVMWLLLQKHKVFINGFDIDDTDATTHTFEDAKVPGKHSVRAEGELFKSLLRDGSITKV